MLSERKNREYVEDRLKEYEREQVVRETERTKMKKADRLGFQRKLE